MYFIPFLLSIFTVSFVGAALTTLSSNPEDLNVPPECSFPRLRNRLLNYIQWNEPVAFEVVLHRECRGHLNVNHRQYIEVFEHLLGVSYFRNVNVFISFMLKKSAYTPEFISAWLKHRPLVSIKTLRVLKSGFRHPTSAALFSMYMQYPDGSKERDYLRQWIFHLQKPNLNWPFSATSPASPLSSPRKSKSANLASKSISWSQFENVPGIHNEQSENEPPSAPPTVTDESITSSIATSDAQEEVKSSELVLNFGHIYGWVSKRNNPIVRNDKKLFQLHGHSVKLQNTFMAFASSKFPLEEYAESSRSSTRSFFDKAHNALLQKVLDSKTSKNFAACRLKLNELQVLLKGDLMLVVLGQREDGNYDFKYPQNPYLYFVEAPPDLHSLDMTVAPGDIVLFLPRELFTNKTHFISPHDVPGSFHFTDLSNFAAMFVNFINYVHYKTSHSGLIAVGGYVHEKK